MSIPGSYAKSRGGTVLVYEDGYGKWGWWCPKCTPHTPNPEVVGNDGYKTRDGAGRAAQNHEKAH